MERNELPKFVTLHDMSRLRLFCIKRNGEVDYDYNEGANFMLERLEKALEDGVEVNMEWANEPIPVRRQGSLLSMHDFLDGAENILWRIGVLILHGGKIDTHTWVFTDMGRNLYHKENFTDMEKLKAMCAQHSRYR